MQGHYEKIKKAIKYDHHKFSQIIFSNAFSDEITMMIHFHHTLPANFTMMSPSRSFRLTGKTITLLVFVDHEKVF